jgi:nifR3 family TIM-barrel protein
MVVAPPHIGDLIMDSSVLMAPMCGLSTRPFRIVARSHGCALTASEMISSEFLVRSTLEDRAGLAPTSAERPTALQVVGARPEALGDSAAMLEDLGADVVDVNMGCPVRKIVSGGGGAALMRDPALASGIVEAMVRRVRVPVTVKLRAGWDEGCLNAASIARAAEDAGAAAVAVHARTRARRHRGRPLLEVIREVKEAVRVPVIGNGGIRTPEDARTMVRETGCGAVMIGRAAIGDVWMFERTSRLLEDGVCPPPPSASERLEVLAEHLRLLVEERGRERAVVLFRKCVPHYLKGVRGARAARHRLVEVKSPEEILRVAREVLLDVYSPVEVERGAGSSGSPSSRRDSR